MKLFVSRPDLLLPFELDDGLRTEQLGRVVDHHQVAVSTQPIARRLAGDGAVHGTIVIAERQTGGVGRLGRAYECPAGGIWCSLILRGPIAPSLGPLVPLAAGVAVAQAIRAETGLPVELKWPNDVLVRGRKIAGTLTELAAEDQAVHYLIVGTGINVNVPLAALPEPLHPLATSVLAETGAPTRRVPLLQRYIERLEDLWECIANGDGHAVIDAWRALPNTIGRRVAASTLGRTFKGQAIDIDDSGALLVETADAVVERVIAADVVHLQVPSQ
jgi:BirA family biotin operon repressor/biotin-[acetyl-CoA-carboxylase] ligase